MSPLDFILTFILCWSIAVSGGYLVVVGLSDVRRHGLASQPPTTRRAVLLLQRGMSAFWRAFLLLLGSVLMVLGMVLLYLLAYD